MLRTSLLRSMSFLAAIVLATLASTDFRGQEAGELRLAVEGKAALPVVISDKASESTKKVAAELAGYLSRITGGRFEVQTGDGKRGIVLGTLAEFPQSHLTQALAVRDTYNGKEAYAIRTEKDR